MSADKNGTGEKRHSEGDGSTREQCNGRKTRGMKEDERK